MNICSTCGEKTKQGKYNIKQKFVCQNCSVITEELFVDEIIFKEGGVELIPPFYDVDEKGMRQQFIDYLYVLFNNKINSAAFRLMNNYRKKGYTWLGMMRAIEWFFVVKRNSISRANHNIGIIPHIYDEAQQFYQYQNQKNKEKAQNYYNSQKVTTERIEVGITPKSKIYEIDMNNL